MKKLLLLVPFLLCCFGIWTFPEYLLCFSWILFLVFAVSIFSESSEQLYADIKHWNFLYISLLLLIIMAISAINFSGVTIHENGYWFVKKYDYYGFLPHAVIDPIKMGGLSKNALIILDSIFACSIIRFKIKNFGDVIFILRTFAILGTIISLYGIGYTFYENIIGVTQGAHRTLGKIASIHAQPMGTYTSLNAYSQFLAMLTATSLGLFLFQLKKWLTNSELGLYCLIYMAMFALNLAALAISIQAQSAFSFIIFTATAGVFIISFLLKNGNTTKKTFLICSIIAVSGFCFLLFTKSDTAHSIVEKTIQKTYSKFGTSQNHTMNQSSLLSDRYRVWEVSLDMLKSNPTWGVGKGCFVYYWDTHYQRVSKNDEDKSNYRLCESAHNDWLQLLCEVGILGSSAIFIGLFLSIKFIVKNFKYLDLLIFSILLGLSTIFAISFFDMPFQNPSIFVLFFALWEIFKKYILLRKNGYRTL